ncbi:flagellar hook-length control protein FliK [Pseudomarimonas arenosa]|uniref:Flagellar hook-length control protein FliK n=1 Tax=Pseudomarimonas arenosa TaxID=2774145 RepID=A0AAW3ZKB2_9GAMM|nr:flagellar hook-length control protein FliK [Pseudomarimonas arenosa]MBD8524736.1 flagellar hook-length control protein FliK [Pseudomarimonas arenosa]
MNSSTLSLFNLLAGDAISSTVEAGNVTHGESQPLFSLPITIDGEQPPSNGWTFGKGPALPTFEPALELAEQESLDAVVWAGLMLPLAEVPVSTTPDQHNPSFNPAAAPSIDAAMAATLMPPPPTQAKSHAATVAIALATPMPSLRLSTSGLAADAAPSSPAPSGPANDLLAPASTPALFSLAGQPAAAPNDAFSEGGMQALVGGSLQSKFAVLPDGKSAAADNLSVANLSAMLANGDNSSAVQQLEQQLTELAAPERRLDLSSSTATERPQQLADAVWAQLDWMADKSVGRASIELHPEDLGQIEIELQMEGKQARVEFVAASAETRHLLETSVPKLREMFAEQGITLADTGVSDGKSQSDSQSAGREHSERNPDRLSSEGESQISVARRWHAGGLSEYA